MHITNLQRGTGKRKPDKQEAKEEKILDCETHELLYKEVTNDAKGKA